MFITIWRHKKYLAEQELKLLNEHRDELKKTSDIIKMLRDDFAKLARAWADVNDGLDIFISPDVHDHNKKRVGAEQVIDTYVLSTYPPAIREQMANSLALLTGHAIAEQISQYISNTEKL